MPPPLQAEEAARLVAEAYTQAEADLVALLARRAAAGANSGYDAWAAAKAAEAAALRNAVLVRTDALEATTVRGYSASRSALPTGRVSPPRSAELVSVGIAAPPLIAGTPTAVLALTQEAVTGAAATHLGMLRQTMDAFRDVQVCGSCLRVATGTTTLPQAIDLSLRTFADRGIRGFVDRAGRQWGLAEYAEMTTRTAVGRAHTLQRDVGWLHRGWGAPGDRIRQPGGMSDVPPVGGQSVGY